MEWAELMDSVMVSDSNTIGLLQIMAAVLYTLDFRRR